MPRFLIALMAAVTFALFLSGTAHARPPLSQNDHINNQLFAAAVGDEIRKNCSSISARMFLVWRKAKALEKYAYDQGYTEEEMRAHLAVDSLKFISLDGLYRAVGEASGRDPKSPQYCDACFSGEYPVKPSDMVEKGFQMKAAE